MICEAAAAATAAEPEAEPLQQRIWNLHDKLSHAILSLSACARRGTAPGCRCRGHAVVKDWRPQGGGGGDRDLEQATMADARSLHAVRAALEDLDGHLHFLLNVQLRQRAERDDAIARLQQSCILLATRLAEHRGKRHGVIEEALAFVDDVLGKSRFVSPEDVYGTRSQSGENEYSKGHGSNMLVRVLSCTLALAKNSLRLERIGGALGNTAVFAVSMLAFMHLHQVAFGKGTPVVQCRRINNSFYSGRSIKNSKEKHLEVLLARG